MCVHEDALVGSTNTIYVKQLRHTSYQVMYCSDIRPTLRYSSTMRGRRKKKSKETS